MSRTNQNVVDFGKKSQNVAILSVQSHLSHVLKFYQNFCSWLMTNQTHAPIFPNFSWTWILLFLILHDNWNVLFRMLEVQHILQFLSEKYKDLVISKICNANASYTPWRCYANHLPCPHPKLCFIIIFQFLIKIVS